jgi:hypothetical protein
MINFDLAQSALKPNTLTECHQLVGHLWAFARSALEKLQWHFLINSMIEPTNDLAERNLRHAVLWRKKTFETRPTRGNRFIERILTIKMTAKQLDKNIIQEISNVIKPNKIVWVLQ